MSGHWRRTLAVLAAALLVGLLFSSLALGKGKPPDDPPPPPPDPVYDFEDLGTLGGGEYDSSGAQAINAYGEVVGTTDTAGGPRAYVWTNGVMTSLGTLGGAASAAADINEVGWIVGSSDTVAGRELAFVVAGGMMLPLDIPPPEGADIVGTSASGINNAGQVVGMANAQPYWGSVGAFWQLDEYGVPLEAIAMLDHTSGWVEVNDSGVIAGAQVRLGGFKPTVGWFDAEGTFVVTLLLDPSDATLGLVEDINSDGWAAGWTQHAPFLVIPDGDIYYRDADGDGWNDLMIALPEWGNPKGQETGFWYARGINDSGQIVGASYEDGLALLYEGGVVYDLNGLIAPAGGTLVTANDINSAGQIVGEIEYEYTVITGPRKKDVEVHTYTHGYRLTPIP